MSTTAVTILENRVEARDLHHLVIEVGAGIAAGLGLLVLAPIGLIAFEREAAALRRGY